MLPVPGDIAVALGVGENRPSRMGKHRRRPVVGRLLDLTAWSGVIGLIGFTVAALVRIRSLGEPKNVQSHSPRHSIITLALEVGVRERDVGVDLPGTSQNDRRAGGEDHRDVAFDTGRSRRWRSRAHAGRAGACGGLCVA
ncbi:hypothetical protein [Nonomuraea sp. NPDC049784]|uniref:hypothetical protein n=1 Tax=Nonomuraea sp. NPDC049784 TaxID=3154361 RepID=UPI0033F96736